VAETYGRVIISEYGTPAKLKTIKPISIGGRAGGDKIIIRNILFKFSTDTDLYSTEENAQKVASHELKVRGVKTFHS